MTKLKKHIDTPPEIAVPWGKVIDHGLFLIEIDGTPFYEHRITIPSERTARRKQHWLSGFGFYCKPPNWNEWRKPMSTFFFEDNPLG